MGKFRMTAAIDETVTERARQIRRALRESGVKVSRDDVATGLKNLVSGFGQNNGKPSQGGEPVYNQAGDTLALAFQHFVAGDVEGGLYMAAMAFTDDSCRPLMDAVVKCNDEAKPENTYDTEENDGEDEALTTTTAGDKKYRDKLTRSIRRVTTAIVANDADDDDDNNNNDDDDAAAAIGADDDDDNDDADASVSTGEEADDDDDDDDDNDNNNNNNDDEEADVTKTTPAPVVGDNMPPLTAKLLKRLQTRPDVIAAANRISLGGSSQSRRRAGKFLQQVGNLSSK